VWNWRSVFVLLCDNLLRIFLDLFFVYPCGMSIVGVRPWIVMVQRFALDCWTCNRICKPRLSRCTIVSLMHLVRVVLFQWLLMAWTRCEHIRSTTYLFVFRIQRLITFFIWRFFLHILLPWFYHICCSFRFELFFSISSLSC